MQNALALQDLLISSARVKRSLARICSMKTIKIAECEITTYCFDEARFIKILVEKHLKIKQHLSEKYLRTLPQEKVKQVASGGIVKQEAKRGMKREDA